MIDSGASASFIDPTFAKSHSMTLTKKTHPFEVSLADGKLAEHHRVSHEIPTELALGGHHEALSLNVTKISYPIMLGIDWLKTHDPLIRWSSHQITFDSPYCTTFCGIDKPYTIVSLDEHPSELTPQPPKSTVESTTLDSGKHLEMKSRREFREVLPRTGLPPRGPRKTSRSQVQRKTPNSKKPVDTPDFENRLRAAPSVSMINSVAFARHLKNPQCQVFQLKISAIAEATSPEGEGVDLSAIPEEYHEFASVFSKKEADKLPEHRHYDHTIPLQEGTAPPFGPVYPLSKVELDVLKDYIDENLRKGFIRHSQSPAGAPILFVKKPDGTLRLCVDYRGLNKITIKNKYPLPLIGELFDRVGKAKYFAKFDLRDGYHRLRMASGEEWKTAMRCRYGLYEFQVMPFGLCNAPGSFQHFTNDTFKDFLDDFLVVYLDDLLIYSDTLEEHKKHIRLVLQRLQDAGLYLKPEKSVFHAQKISFLGFIISPEGVSMDPVKVEAITSWPEPQSAHDIQVFLGFANFYRRFIQKYSKIAAPLTNLLKKGVPFQWSKKPRAAFKYLKEAFTTAPILRHFDRSKPAIIETDASDEAFGGAISQMGDDGILYPCAFVSKKFDDAQRNYEIYDKEMFAIVECMYGHWRHYLEGSGHQTTVITDHKNLLWFTETKIYSRRHARWAEKLSRFDFIIKYRPGSESGLPDALSRRPDHMDPKGGGGNKARNEFAFLKPSQLQNLEQEGPGLMVASVSALEVTPIDDTLAAAIRAALPLDPNIGEYIKHLEDPTLPREEDVAEYLNPFSLRENLVLREGLVYVPDDNEIKLRILQQYHDSTTAGHLGQAKTLELISREYYWPRIRQYVNEYVNSCDTCCRNKTSRQQPHGKLHPLPIPAAPWESVSMDFIVELPESHNHNAVLVCVDRFTKMAHFCPTTTQVTAEETASLYLRHVFKHHGLPTNIVSDRGTQFTSHFASRLYELCDIKSNKSTSFHPQSDGQTERVNQVLEQYLRTFCDYQQDDWFDILPLAEFTYNNAQHSSTQVSPFFANYGFNPRCRLKVLNDQGVPVHPIAEGFIEKQRAIYKRIKENLRHAQAKYKEFYDTHHKESPPFKVGDLVWLSRRNITTTRPSPKLDYKRLGPFKIIKVVGESKMAFKLDLPASMKIHPVFHSSLLYPYQANTLPGRTQPPPPPVVVDGEEEWEVKEILDSRIRYNKLEYLVSWDGFGPDSNGWEPAAHMENSPEKVALYHDRHPNRPSPKDIVTSQREGRKSKARKVSQVLNP
jgi:hypothetical protein